MSQLAKQKYQIAWFKLSEFVRCGEKERALGIYKLLMHTIDDSAFAKQLEGDLLLFFNDNNAIQSYLAAAHLYKKNNKLAQTTAIYEHLVAQFPQESTFLESLISCYLELNHPTRILLSLTRLINPLVQAQQIPSIIKALDDISLILTEQEQASLYVKLVSAILQYEKDTPEIMQDLLKKIKNILPATAYKSFVDNLEK